MSTDWKAWAQRNTSRAGHMPADPAPAPRSAPVYQPPAPAQAAAQALAPPPPGYGYVAHPAYGWMLAPLAGPPVTHAPPQAQAWPQHQSQPQVPPQAHGGGRPAPLESNTLVKSGGKAPDVYAQMMANVPDLMPDQGYDAMAGRPNPLTVQELGGYMEFNDRAGAANPEAPTRSFLRPTAETVQALGQAAGPAAAN